MLAPSGFPFNPPLPRSARQGRLPPLPLPAPPLPASCPCRSLRLPAPAARRCARLCPLASAVSPLRRLLPPFLPAPAASWSVGRREPGLPASAVLVVARPAGVSGWLRPSRGGGLGARPSLLPLSFLPVSGSALDPPPPSALLWGCASSACPSGAPRAPLATPPRPPARPPRTSRRGPALRRPAAPSLPSCALPPLPPGPLALFVGAPLRRPARPLPALSPARLGRAVAVPLALGLLRRPGRPLSGGSSSGSPPLTSFKIGGGCWAARGREGRSGGRLGRRWKRGLRRSLRGCARSIWRCAAQTCQPAWAWRRQSLWWRRGCWAAFAGGGSGSGWACSRS